MSINKFGSSAAITSGCSAGSGIRGPRGYGYKLNANGHFDLENRKLCNVHTPTDPNDACNKLYVDDCFQKQTADIVASRALIEATLNTNIASNKSRLDKLEQETQQSIKKLKQDVKSEQKKTISSVNDVTTRMQTNLVDTVKKSFDDFETKITKDQDTKLNSMKSDILQSVTTQVDKNVKDQADQLMEAWTTIIETKLEVVDNKLFNIQFNIPAKWEKLLKDTESALTKKINNLQKQIGAINRIRTNVQSSSSNP